MLVNMTSFSINSSQYEKEAAPSGSFEGKVKEVGSFLCVEVLTNGEC